MKVIVLAALSLFFSATGFAHPGHGGHLTFLGGQLHAHLSWADGPNDGEESRMRLEWRDGATHSLVEPGLSFEVMLWMPSMGHGSAPTQIQRVLDAQGQVVAGVYEVTNMYFLMPGDWDVRVSLKGRDGQVETKTWSIMVEGDGHGGHH